MLVKWWGPASCLCLSAGAAITKFHAWWLKQQKIVLSGFWRLEGGDQGVTAFFLLRSMKEDLRVAGFFLCLYMVFTLCACLQISYKEGDK